MPRRVGQPRVVRKVTRYHKTAGVMKGRPKAARDLVLGLSVERVQSQKLRQCANQNCQARWIIEGQWFAVLYTGATKRVNKSMVPITRDYHFNCLPKAAKPLARFFE